MSIGSSITNYFKTLARGTTSIGFPTSTPVDANTQALHVNLSGINAVNATLGAETTKVIGTVNQGTSPWVTNDPGLPDTLGQKPMATSTSVVIASDQSGILVNPDATVAPTALAALNAEVQIPLNGHGTVIVTATGTFSGTVSFRGLMPDGAWQSVTGFGTLDGAKTGGIFSGASNVRIITSGLRALQAIMTAYTSGTATVSLQASRSTYTPPAPSVIFEGTTSAESVAAVVILARTAGTGATAIAKTPIVDANGGWVLGTSAASIGTSPGPALVKGTQGAVGHATQDLKDAGRNAVHFYTLIPVLSSATDTLQSLTGTKAGATVVATVTPAVVTAGKTLRVTRMAATYIATAASGYGMVRLRFNPAGLAAITSPIAATFAVGSGAPVTVNATGAEEATLSDGWEFAAGTGIGISVQGFAAVTATAVGYVLVSVTGYEY